MGWNEMEWNDGAAVEGVKGRSVEGSEEAVSCRVKGRGGGAGGK